MNKRKAATYRIPCGHRQQAGGEISLLIELEGGKLRMTTFQGGNVLEHVSMSHFKPLYARFVALRWARAANLGEGITEGSVTQWRGVIA